ncbi:testis-specific expressed protein 55-like [Branchiostoma lanceolatum]|uniref:testis-specific expressed protein 55-like n=1 Tax=Branchiostoma lanceolatum TaxID=7740 RepID=UPI00345417A1
MAAAGGVLIAEQVPSLPEPVLLTQVEVEEEPTTAPAEEHAEPPEQVPESAPPEAPAPEPPKITEEERAAEVISREVTKSLDFLTQQRSVATQAAVIPRPILSRRAKKVEVVGYKPPVEDPLETAILYVQEKGILYIFQTLLERLVFQKPPNPLQFLRKEIVALQEELQEYEKQRLKRVAAMKK